MNRALGLVEVIGLTNAIIVADTMLKAANIKMENIEITKGMGFVTVKVSGDVGAVKAAVDSGKSLAVSFDKFVSSKVIPRPANGLDDIFDLDKENRENKNSKPKIEEKIDVKEKKDTTLNKSEVTDSVKSEEKNETKINQKADIKKQSGSKTKPEVKVDKKTNVKKENVNNSDKNTPNKKV